MRRVIVIGLSHKTAPVEVREPFAVAQQDLPDLLAELEALPHLGGVMATSTCNRFEIYATADEPAGALDDLRRWLARRGNTRVPDVGPYLYDYADERAVHHVFRVASSLDSMVVGEAQILGQVKLAYVAAKKAGTLDLLLDRCVTRAVKVAKQIRTETNIAKNPVSVPQVSVELARKIFGDLTDRQVLIIGAGKMSEMAARNLSGQGVSQTHVANRSPERAQRLAARLHGQAHTLEAIPQLLGQVDIVISSTDSREHVLYAETVKAALPVRRYRPLFVIDIAVPRDVEPKVGQLSNVYLFDIDDLQKVVDANLGERQREAVQGERIVAEHAHRFTDALNVDRVTPTIVSLRQKLGRIKDEETERALRGLDGLDPRVRERVEKLANTLVNRILHGPTVGLKRLAASDQSDEVVDLVQALFELEIEPIPGENGGRSRG